MMVDIRPSTSRNRDNDPTISVNVRQLTSRSISPLVDKVDTNNSVNESMSLVVVLVPPLNPLFLPPFGAYKRDNTATASLRCPRNSFKNDME